MTSLAFLHLVGVEAQEKAGRVVLFGLERLPEAVAARIVETVRPLKMGLLLELRAGPRPDTPEQVAAFAQSHPHLISCPAARNPWFWIERTWCTSKCATPCLVPDGLEIIKQYGEKNHE